MNKRKAVFLDRDGTLINAVTNRSWLPNKPITAPFSIKELEFVPCAREAVDLFKAAGYVTIIITNQPDVANGYVTGEEWDKIHQAVLREICPDDCFMCRHPSDHPCELKKPKPGMILAAADKWGIDLTSSFMIGDTSADTLAGKAAGCKTILLRWPYNLTVEADYIMPDLISAAHMIASRLY